MLTVLAASMPMGLAALVILGADDGLEQVAGAEHIERGFGEFPMTIEEPR
jgi:hypothetical protein